MLQLKIILYLPATTVILTLGWMQCAAVTTHFSLMMEPPQKPSTSPFKRTYRNKIVNLTTELVCHVCWL